jgi:MoaA/NifB/PqqE/SkfB family radical SAM enzyme
MKHPTYCSFPFESIAPKSWQQGKPHRVTPCCNMKGETDDPMGVKELIDAGASLQDIFSSKQFDALRKDLLSGIRNSACDYCWKMEAKTGASPRLTAIEPLKISQVQATPKLKKIDTMVDESCNLRCRMCAPSVSNSLRQDYNRIVELELPIPEYYNMKQNESQSDPRGVETYFAIGEKYQQEIVDLAQQIDELKFTGGEPTTSSVFWNIVDSIVDKSKIKLHLTTNGTKFNERFLETAAQFGSRHFTISVDATRSTYEYMRYPFSWRQLEKNIEQLCDTQDPATTEIHICSVLTVYNMINIRNLVDWIHQHNWYSEHKITWKCIPDPHPVDSCLDVKWVDPELIETAWMNMSVALEDATAYTRPALQKTCNYLTNCMEAVHDAELVNQKRQQLKRDTLTLDIVREQNYEEILYPQIADFISSIRVTDELPTH